MPWLMDELAIYCFHCLLGNTSKWLRALLRWQRRWRAEWYEQHSAVNNNMVGVVYNSITTTRWRRNRQRPTVTGDISMESHSQYLASPHCYLWLRFLFMHSKYCLCSLLIITASQGRKRYEKCQNGETIEGGLLKYIGTMYIDTQDQIKLQIQKKKKKKNC